MSENNHPRASVDVKSIIEIGTWVIGIATAVLTVVFWIQTQGSDKYYPKLSGENLEKQVVRMEQKFDSLEAGNREIIRLLGRLEASQEKHDQ